MRAAFSRSACSLRSCASRSWRTRDSARRLCSSCFFLSASRFSASCLARSRISFSAASLTRRCSSCFALSAIAAARGSGFSIAGSGFATGGGGGGAGAGAGSGRRLGLRFRFRRGKRFLCRRRHGDRCRRCIELRGDGLRLPVLPAYREDQHREKCRVHGDGEQQRRPPAPVARRPAWTFVAHRTARTAAAAPGARPCARRCAAGGRGCRARPRSACCGRRR